MPGASLYLETGKHVSKHSQRPPGRQVAQWRTRFQKKLFLLSVCVSLFRDPGPQNRSFLFLHFGEGSFLISGAFGKECQGPQALIFSEMGHRVIGFHRAHIFTSHWLCARMMLNVRSPAMNQTWPLDFSFKRGERQAKKTKDKDTHVLSEEWGGGSSVGGFRRALKAKEVCRGGAGHPGQKEWHKQRPKPHEWHGGGSNQSGEVMSVFLQMWSPDAYDQHHLG